MDSDGNSEPGPSKRRRVETVTCIETEDVPGEDTAILVSPDKGITAETDAEQQGSQDLVISGGEFTGVQFGERHSEASVKLEEFESMSFGGSGDNPQKVEKLMEQAFANTDDFREAINSSASRQTSESSSSHFFQILHESERDSVQATRHFQHRISDASNSSTIMSDTAKPDHHHEPSMQTSQSQPSMITGMAGGELEMKHEFERSQSLTMVTGGRIKGAHFGNQIRNQKIEGHVHMTKETHHHHHHHHDPKQEKQPLEKCAEFLKRANIHYNKTNRCTDDTSSVVQANMMLVDMERKKQGGRASVVFDKTETQFGRDIREIGLNELFDEHNNKMPRHVMMLGQGGAGKTTLSSIFAASANDGQVDTMKNIELVHFVRASHLQPDAPTTAFDLIFTDQMAGDPETELDDDLQKAGQQWLANNSNKMLLIIEGLDQLNAKLRRMGININHKTPAKADVILANIMSGNIWSHAKILTTSQWLIYAELTPKQKPDKAIALRGFDHDKMEKAAEKLVSDVGSREAIISSLRKEDSGRLSLYRNPQFLFYTAEVPLQNLDPLPENLSGLMAAVFLQFATALYDLQSLTKLAFCGMMDNTFIFTEKYIAKLGIDPENLKGPTDVITYLWPGQSLSTTRHRKYTFSHQSMQELFAAVHLFNLDPDEVRSLVSKELNDEKMETVRKIFYGMVTNEKSSRLLMSYIKDKACSITKCQEIILDQLRSFVSGGVINGITIVSLLYECGPDIIERLGAKIIEIDYEGLHSNEELALVTVIPQCTDLQLVKFAYLELGPQLLLELHQLSNVKIYAEELLVMDDMHKNHRDMLVKFLDTAEYDEIELRCADDLKEILFSHWISTMEVPFIVLILTGSSSAGTFRLLSKFLALFRLKMLVLCQTECTEEKLDILNFELEEFSPQIQCLTFDGEDLLPEGFNKLATTIGKLGCSELQLQNCKLSVEKLKKFGDQFQEEETVMQCLAIQDEDLTPEGFGELATTVGKAHCWNLRLQDCELSAEKLVAIGSRCQEESIEIQHLAIQDKDLPSNDFGDLATAIGNMCCLTLHLQDCELSAKKLKRLGSRCQKEGIQIQYLAIQDEDLTPEGFGELATTVGMTCCSTLHLQDCELSVKKLKKLGSRCQKEGIQVDYLLVEDKNLAPDEFDKLAMTVGEVSCSFLHLQNCELSVEKLQIFSKRCQDENTEVEHLTIQDQDLTPDGFDELATTVGKMQCWNLFLEDCELSAEKLMALGGRCRDENIKVQDLTIEDQDLTPDGFRELAVTVNRINCTSLCLQNCDLSVEKLLAFGRGCQSENVEVVYLAVQDQNLDPDGFGELAVAAGMIHCWNLLLQDCELSAEKLMEFGRRCQNEYIMVQSLTIEDQDLTPEGFGELAKTVRQCGCTDLCLQNCELYVEKLTMFGRACRDTYTEIKCLTINEGEIEVTDEMITVLCGLMNNVVEELEINGWQIHDEGKDRLLNILNLPTSAVKTLQLPGEGKLQKGSSENLGSPS